MRKIKINRNGNVEIHHDDVQHFDSGGTVIGGPGGGGTTDSSTNPNTGPMGTVNGWLGLNNNFQAQAANIQQGTNAAQLNNAYTGVQDSMGEQNKFATALAGQNGLGNQANIFNQQQALSNALQNQSEGKGPNPAQAQLAQNTAANTANQASLMAGQRGSAANAGLIARQASMQGAQNQQAAVGQQATLQAQQQLAAQGALANQQAQMQGVASNQIAAQGQQVNTNAQSQQSEQGILQNANTSANNAAVGMQENMNNNNSATSAANQNMAANTMGGMLKGATSVASMFAKGGVVGKKMPSHIKGMAMLYHPTHKFAEGGEIQEEPSFEAPPKESGNAAQENIDDKSTANQGAALDSDKGSAPSESSEDIGSKWSSPSTTASNGPGGGAAVSLPADQTNFADSIQSPGGSGGGGGGGGGMMSMAAMMARGGQVPRYANGGINLAGSFGSINSTASNGPGGGAAVNMPSGKVEDFSQDIDIKQKPKSTGTTDPNDQGGPSGDDTAPQASQQFSNQGALDKAIPFSKGGLAAKGGGVGGKAKVGGAKDSYKNDTEPAMLSPGEIVLPRHVTQSDDPVGNAAKFVAALLSKNKDLGQGNEEQDFKMALKKAISSRRK